MHFFTHMIFILQILLSKVKQGMWEREARTTLCRPRQFGASQVYLQIPRSSPDLVSENLWKEAQESAI